MEGLGELEHGFAHAALEVGAPVLVGERPDKDFFYYISISEHETSAPIVAWKCSPFRNL